MRLVRSDNVLLIINSPMAVLAGGGETRGIVVVTGLTWVKITLLVQRDNRNK